MPITLQRSPKADTITRRSLVNLFASRIQITFLRSTDGNGETSITSRPLKYSEVAEWILLDGTPSTCANVALHNIHPEQIDLVISGPNLGRNTSSALALSSGTIGAALSSSLSKTRSIAISYATVLHPTPTTFFDPAHILGGRIISHLWHNWGEDQGGLRGEADLYSVNIPLIEGLLDDQGLEICWTRMWRNSYGRLFQAVSTPESGVSKCTVNAAGPDSLSTDLTSVESSSCGPTSDESGDLVFKWSPDMNSLITPSLSTLPPGSDGWAIHKGWVSVTPLRASFAEPPVQDVDIEDKVRKVKL